MKFLRHFSSIFGIQIKFAMFWLKKKASWVKYYWSYWLGNTCLFHFITGLYSESPLAVNLLASLKNSLNLKKSTFILLFHNSEPKWIRKSFFSSDLRFLDCLITCVLPITNILVVIKRIYSFDVKSNYPENLQHFATFFFRF